MQETKVNAGKGVKKSQLNEVSRHVVSLCHFHMNVFMCLS